MISEACSLLGDFEVCPNLADDELLTEILCQGDKVSKYATPL